MAEIEIKNEFYIKDQCHTCLSIGRKLRPIGRHLDIYKKIVLDYPLGSLHLGPDNVNKDLYQVLLCWECESMLKKAQQFQELVKKANELLQFGQKYLNITLSNLTTILLNETHPHIIYIDEATIKTEENHETASVISDNDNSNLENTSEIPDNDSFDATPVNEIKIEDIEQKTVKDVRQKEIEERKAIKKVSKWAIKNARKNKKPKFKIVDDNRDCYKAVRMNTEEMEHLIRIKNKKYLKLRYKCGNCLCGFKKLSLFEKHLEDCKKDSGKYFCDICKKGFLDKHKLSTHIKKHNCKRVCMLCSYTTYEEGHMKLHVKKKHTMILKCLKCGLIFDDRRTFFKHHKEWHEKFSCDYCGISFKMRYSIKDHIRKVHSPFECKPCNKRFSRYGGLWRHNKTKHSTLPPVGAYCVECDRHYEHMYQYKSHLNNSARHRSSNRKQRYPCTSCDRVFTKNIYLKDHNNLVHLKIINFRCEECNKIFVRNADLISHRRRVHEGILPPRDKICDICGRGFTTRKILTNHVRTHTGERPYECACGVKFAQAAALTAHARATGHRT